MIQHDRRRFALGLAALGATGTLSHAQSSDYPNRPIRIVIPFATGGPTDTMTRLLASRMSDELKQQVVPDNRPGAGGNIGAETVARADADGYTLLMGTNGILAANKNLFERISYDPDRDFTPISMYVYQPNLLAVHPDVPAHDVKELIAWLKAHPGTTYASGGLGTSTHFAGELMRTMIGAQMQHIPYKGDGQSVPDVIAGNVPVLFCSVLAGMKWLNTGKLRVLGVTSATRVPVIDSIPTIAESGLPGFDLTSWYAVVAPARTPRGIVAHLNTAMLDAMASPEVKDKLEAMGSILAPGTPDQLRTHIRQESARWARIIEQVNIKL